MSPLHTNVDAYLQQLTTAPSSVAARMERDASQRDFPIVGPQVGALLRWLARSIEARHVLELGSGFGYSALWLADAVGRRGYVILTEGSKDRAREARERLAEAGLGERARTRPDGKKRVSSRASFEHTPKRLWMP